MNPLRLIIVTTICALLAACGGGEDDVPRKSWRAPVAVAQPYVPAAAASAIYGYARVDDRAGQATVAWQDSGGANYVAQKASQSGSWSDAFLLNDPAGKLTGPPRLFLAPNGDVVAIWETRIVADDSLTVELARYVKTSNRWTNGQTLITYPPPQFDNCCIPTVAFDSNDEPVVLSSSTRTSFGLWAHDAATDAWRRAPDVVGPDPMSATVLRLASSGGKRFVLVWEDFPAVIDGDKRLGVAQFDGQVGAWSSPQIELLGHCSFFDTLAAANTKGDVLVTSDCDGGLRFDRFNATANAFLPSTTIPSLTGSSFLYAAEDGRDLVVCADGARHFVSIRYAPPENGWSAAVRVDSDELDGSTPVSIADAAGNVITVWSRISATATGEFGARGPILNPPQQTVMANRFDNASGTWGVPQVIADSASTLFSGDYTLRADARNDVVVDWVNRYIPTQYFTIAYR